MYVQIMQMLGDVFDSGVEWFITVLNSAGMTSYFLAVVFLSLLYKFVLAPIFYVATFSGASDTVQRFKYENRSHGKFERNYTGKFSKKR